MNVPLVSSAFNSTSFLLIILNGNLWSYSSNFALYYDRDFNINILDVSFELSVWLNIKSQKKKQKQTSKVSKELTLK